MTMPHRPTVPDRHRPLRDDMPTMQQLRLHTFTSAAFPIGAYTFSHGIEAAICESLIHDRISCFNWIKSLLTQGSFWNDAVLLCQAWALVEPSGQVNEDALLEVNELALALCAGAERYRETVQMGAAFVRAASVWPDSQHPVFSTLPTIALPIAIGTLGALNKLPIQLMLPISLQASTSNLVWIVTRLLPMGQTDSLRVISELEPVLIDVADKAMHASLDELGSCTLLSDIASIEHESLVSRVCVT